MNNFKSGSGKLDFGGSDDEGTDESPEEEPEKPESEEPSPVESDSPTHSTASVSDPQTQDRHQYPYFVRRSNVTDERDSHIELHLRENVADAEAPFRNELAETLGTDEIAKTDAREFALLFAYENPEGT